MAAIQDRTGSLHYTNQETNTFCPVCQPERSGRDMRLYYKYDGEKLLAHCKHGCQFADIAKRFPKREQEDKPRWELLREHTYYLEDGTIFGRKRYYRVDGKKQPSWQKYDGTTYRSGLSGAKAPLYNIDKLVNADVTRSVWIVEGEKDADTLTTLGYLSISPPNGAGYWANDFNRYLKSRHVIIVPDNDEPGMKHMERLKNNLSRFAASVRIIDLRDIYPDLKKGGDISDVLQLMPNAMADIERLIQESTPTSTRTFELQFVTDNRGKPTKSYENFKLLLEYYDIEVRYNTITGVEFSGRLPPVSEENKESVCHGYIYSLTRDHNINFSQAEITAYLTMLADSNIYSPVKDYLHNLPPAEKGYIRSYFDCLAFDKSELQHHDMYLTLFVKWLIQCVAMQYNTLERPYSADGAFGLQCETEGNGKTSFFMNLAFDPKYFKDSVQLRFNDKDSLRKAISYWICELGEIEGSISESVAANYRAFITEQSDSYRLPWAVGFTNKPRRTSFCFTCNAKEFLPGGENRRFWTVPIVDVDLDTIRAFDIDKLWSEVFSLYNANPQGFRLDKDEMAFVKQNNREKFAEHSNIEDVLRDTLDFTLDADSWIYRSSTQLSLQIFDDKRHAMEIGKVLTTRFCYSNDRNTPTHYKISAGIKQYHVPPYFVPYE